MKVKLAVLLQVARVLTQKLDDDCCCLMNDGVGGGFVCVMTNLPIILFIHIALPSWTNRRIYNFLRNSYLPIWVTFFVCRKKPKSISNHKT